MTKSDEIRKLAAGGMATADIARKIGVRYQFAYNVLGRRNDGGSTTKNRDTTRAVKVEKPILHANTLAAAGFVHAATWIGGDAEAVKLDQPLIREAGVYAFSVDGRIMYVGLASMGLAKRIYFYARPGISQRTSLRLNQMLKDHVTAGKSVIVYVATPSDGIWNGLPVDFCAGVELGLIRTFSLPWNKRSAG